MKRNWWLLIAVLSLVTVVSCGACAIKFSSSAKQQITELNENMKGSREDVQGLKAELAELNDHLAEVKAVVMSQLATEGLQELAATLKRIADTLEALNSKAGEFVEEEGETP